MTLLVKVARFIHTKSFLLSDVKKLCQIAIQRAILKTSKDKREDKK